MRMPTFLLQDLVKHQTRFVSQKPAKVVLSTMEVVAQSMGFKTHIRNYKVGFYNHRHFSLFYCDNYHKLHRFLSYILFAS